MKILIIINNKAGSSNLMNDEFSDIGITNIFKKLKIEAEIFRVEGKDIIKTVKSNLNKNFEVIAAAGGDGTISAVAEALFENETPLGVIPFGTLNHFAKDLNIPLTLEEAAKIISKNKIVKIDVAEVNGRKFINNSSIGLYPKIVKKRKESEKLGGSKWTAMGLAFANIFSRFPLLKVIVQSNGESSNCKTPYVFIGNNEYSTDFLNVGSRESINKGTLSVYFPNNSSRLSMLRFALNGLLNRLDQQKDFTIILTKKLLIKIKKKKIDVSLDGEVVKLETPLEYKIHPKKLNVIVP
ncbi:MAG: diacylglycerol kinase family protein [Ignavibacteriaceae bacterium]